MSSSAVLCVAARDLTGTAEAHLSEHQQGGQADGLARVPDLRVALRRGRGRADLLRVLNSKKPRPVVQHRNGASKTVHSHTSMKEAATYGDQGTRPRQEDHDDRPARREDHHDHPQGWWFPVTAPAIEQVNLAAVEHAIAVVLVRHGLADHDTVQVSARTIEQGGHITGVTIDVFAGSRPAGLPATPPATADEFTAMAEDLEAVS